MQALPQSATGLGTPRQGFRKRDILALELRSNRSASPRTTSQVQPHITKYL
jgi:hypothetical protein